MNPSLAMLPCAFDAGKLYSVLPDTGAGDFTVSRNGTATYLGADGLLKTAQANEPRLEFNTDGSFRGVLVEPSATNLLQRSEQFGDSYWNKQQISVTSNNSTAPNGAMTADKLIPDTSSNQHRIFGFANFSGQGVLSVYAKADGYNFLSFGVAGGASYSSIIFNLSNGTISGTSSGVTPTIQNQGNGWYRCSISGASIGFGVSVSYWVIVRDSNSTANYAGDGVSGVLVWGAQLEVGSVATSYIPTIDTTITRPADIITRTNAQDLIGQTEGAIYAEGFINDLNELFRVIFSIQNGGSMILGVGFRGNRVQRIIRDSLNFTSEQFGPTFQNGQLIKVCVTYLGTNIKLYVNGILVNTTSGRNPFQLGLNLITISGDGTFAKQNNTQLKSAAIFKTALSDEEAISITSL
jgi:hypothetical protein